MPKVSVIIPIYNVEKYLEQCLNSVVNQTLEDIEIICVDDGSPDNCGKIVDEFAAKDSRIVAVHKENGGYGSAINYGLKIAKGEYIGIVESDDWISPNMYELLYNKAVATNSEIVKGAFWYVTDSENDKKHISKFVIDQYMDNESFNIDENPQIISHFTSIWSAVYRRDWMIENEIKMVEDIRPYEDLPFMATVYSKANKITLLPEAVYFYRVDAAGSSGNTVKRSIINYVPQRIKSHEIFIKNNKFASEIMEHFWRMGYIGSKNYYVKPNNKFRREFYYEMQKMFRLSVKDKCTFKYFKRSQKTDFKNIMTMPYWLYVTVSTVKSVLPKIFSIIKTQNKKHKVVTILGIKVKINIQFEKYGKFFKLLDYFIPKNPRKIVFCSFPDYSDNAKEYYEYLLKNHKDEYELVWLCKQNIDNVQIPTSKKKLNSWSGVWDLLTAKYTVSTFFGLENLISSNKRVNLQLWHGMPLKTIGYMEKNIPDRMFKAYKRNKNNYFFVTSDIFKLSMISCFLADPNKIFITGQSRNDCINSNRNQDKIKEFLNTNKFKKVVLFTPTYKECKRKDGGRDVDREFDNIFYLDNYDQNKFFKLLEDENILLVIKPHPFEEPFYKSLQYSNALNHPNIKVIYNNDLRNNKFYFYEFFSLADLMITDFSSIGLDYLISNKPIIFLNSLANEYNKNRGFVLEDNHEIIMPGHKVYSFDELLNAIQDSLTIDSYKECRNTTMPLIHKYVDNNASKRIVEIMKGL